MADEAYLPQTGDDLDLVTLTVQKMPGRTYRLNTESGRITGFADDAEALKQAVYLILSTERYRYPIYSRNYGVELEALIGKPKDYAMSEVKRRISEALLQDDRVESVDSWTFESLPNALICTFTVHSIYGNFTFQKEVEQ